MSLFARLFSECCWSHGDMIRDFARGEDGRITMPRVMVMRCARCQTDLGAVLAGQQLRVRKVKKPKPVKRSSAAVLKPATWSKR